MWLFDTPYCRECTDTIFVLYCCRNLPKLYLEMLAVSHMFYILDKDVDFMLLLSFLESWVRFVINYGALLL